MCAASLSTSGARETSDRLRRAWQPRAQRRAMRPPLAGLRSRPPTRPRLGLCGERLGRGRAHAALPLARRASRGQQAAGGGGGRRRARVAHEGDVLRERGVQRRPGQLRELRRGVRRDGPGDREEEDASDGEASRADQAEHPALVGRLAGRLTGLGWRCRAGDWEADVVRGLCRCSCAPSRPAAAVAKRRGRGRVARPGRSSLVGG